MKRIIVLLTFLAMILSVSCGSKGGFMTDTFKTKSGELKITFIGHGTLMMQFGDKIIHVDPVTSTTSADYSKLPKADLILVTHEHYDHLEVKTIELISKENTQVVINKNSQKDFDKGIVMKNGDVKDFFNIKVEAVPAYNLVHKRDNGAPFHPKGEGNGYVLTFDDLRVYVAGDSENFPEMKDLKNIDIAFLPMNLPYTMTPEMVFEGVKLFNPKILYPYHFGDTDTSIIVNLLKDNKDVDVRIRDFKLKEYKG
jgi:L-ascorbate metabolism protein UlaG (beta-lactamase superfamily)